MNAGLDRQSRKRRHAFTLVEIMIVVAIIALLAAIAVPGFLRARKRSQASKVLNDLRSIDSAVDQYAIEHSRISGDPVPVAAWTAYLKPGSRLAVDGRHPTYGPYGNQIVDAVPKVTAAGFTAFADLSDVAPSTFWKPYYSE